MASTTSPSPSASTSNGGRAWVVTGPTSGIGHRTALALAEHGTVVLVGRSRTKLDAVEREIRARGGDAVSVVADLSDIVSARRAAAEIATLELPVAGVLNNAGIFPGKSSTSVQGWDATFATDHLGPFALTEALLPSLADGTHIVFIASAVEDPERRIAVAAGFRGSRFVSAESSARGEWRNPGGSKLPGADAYASSKQGNLVTALAFAREFPRLRFSAIEPGVNPGSNLSRDSNAVVVFIAKYLFSPIAPLFPYFTTPRRAARVITTIVTDGSASTGVYFDEKGRPMRGSRDAHDPVFQDRYVAETRALLATVQDETTRGGV